jgi:hypothetical protein
MEEELWQQIEFNLNKANLYSDELTDAVMAYVKLSPTFTTRTFNASVSANVPGIGATEIEEAARALVHGAYPIYNPETFIRIVEVDTRKPVIKAIESEMPYDQAKLTLDLRINSVEPMFIKDLKYEVGAKNYQQYIKDTGLTAFKFGNVDGDVTILSISDGYRTCTKCNKSLPIEDYYKGHAICKKCYNANRGKESIDKLTKSFERTLEKYYIRRMKLDTDLEASLEAIRMQIAKLGGDDDVE